jgi:SAM-dependent methyltransferase
MAYQHRGLNVFDEMGNYWAEIADEDQTERQLQFLKNHLKWDGYVLDLACGTGRHTIPLSKQGFHVVGLDASPKLLKIAKHHCKDVELVWGDMRFLPFKVKAFGAVISMDTSLGYLPSEKEDAESVAEVRRVIAQGGDFFVDVFNRQNLIKKYQGRAPSAILRDYPSFVLQQKRAVSYGGEWLCDSWTIRDKSDGQVRVYEHTVRLYAPTRLQGLLEAAGFAVKQFFGDYEAQAFSADSSRLIVVASAN